MADTVASLDVVVDSSGAQSGAAQVKRSIEDIKASANDTAKSLKSIFSSLRNTIASIFGAYMVRNIARSFLEAARSAEDYRTSIRAVSSSIEEADATFDRIRKWAAVNPIDTDEAVGAFVRLRTAAVENSEGALNAIADLATVMHADMRDVASAVVTTETETLRNYGIILDRTGKQATIQMGNVRKTVEKDLDSIRAAIIEVIEESIGGSMQKAANTYSGVLDTMSGMWTDFQQDVMGISGKGPFDAVKNSLIDLRDEWEAFTKTKDYEQLVQEIQGTLVDAIKTARDITVKLGDAFLFAKDHAQELKDILAILVTIKLTSWFIAAGEAAITLATAIKGVTAAAMAFAASNPLTAGLTVAGVTGLWFGKNYAQYKQQRDDAKEQQRWNENWEKAVAQNTLRDMASKAVGIGNPTMDFIAQHYGLKKTQTWPTFDLEKFLGMFPDETPDTSTKSAAELLVENIRGQIKYLYADGESFIPILDQWIARSQTLGKDWRALKDLKQEIVDTAAERNPFSPENMLESMKETQSRMAALREESAKLRQAEYDNYAWQNDAGLMSNGEYLNKVAANFERLKAEFASTGAAAENFLLWPEELRNAFSTLQSAILQNAEPAIETLKKQLNEGKLSVDEYKRAAQELVNTLTTQGLSQGNAETLLKQLTNDAESAKRQIIDLNELTKTWVEDFQSGERHGRRAGVRLQAVRMEAVEPVDASDIDFAAFRQPCRSGQERFALQAVASGEYLRPPFFGMVFHQPLGCGEPQMAVALYDGVDAFVRDA